MDHGPVTEILGQFEPKRLEQVVIVCGSGGGLLLMSLFLYYTVRKFGWRLGLQAVTVTLVAISVSLGPT